MKSKDTHYNRACDYVAIIDTGNVKIEEKVFVPKNRWIVIEPIETKKTEESKEISKFIIPESQKNTARYGIFKVIACCEPNNLNLIVGKEIVVDATMVETIEFGEQKIQIILENYVILVNTYLMGGSLTSVTAKSFTLTQCP